MRVMCVCIYLFIFAILAFPLLLKKRLRLECVGHGLTAVHRGGWLVAGCDAVLFVSGEPELSSGLSSLALSDERRPRSNSRSQETTALEVRCVTEQLLVWYDIYFEVAFTEPLWVSAGIRGWSWWLTL